MLNNDIIAAIATAYGHGAIGIVRVSGSGAMDIISRIFRTSVKLESHKMAYGHIVASTGEVIDEVMLCPMLAPRSYTMEDTVEIYCHGGIIVLRSVLDTVLKEGARLAEPGEFTKRAFLNGRINLTQAEAVMDVINAGSDAARRAGLRQLGGGLSQKITQERDKILTWIAHIELSIDYPEHEEEAVTLAQILGQGGKVIESLEGLLATAEVGRMLRDGVKTVILGRPNAGKSTLLNAILSEDRAIVHENEGTTRDVLTERVVVGSVPLMLMDTAGIRETIDPVEKIGVDKTLAAADDAELVLYVIDGTKGIDARDRQVIHKHKMCNKPVLVIINKCDLIAADVAQEIVDDACQICIQIEKAHGDCETVHDGKDISLPVLQLSTLTGAGMDSLFTKISEILALGVGDANGDADIITRERHRILLDQAINFVRSAMAEIKNNVPEDLVSVSLRGAYLALGEVVGVEVADDILDRIFAEFCLGK